MTRNSEAKALEAFLLQHVRQNGGISFAEYMSQCLYHPQYGYYMVSRDRIGKGGDFFTSSSVHSLFGRLIAKQLHEMWDILGRDAFTVVEQGAGEGHLCLDILDSIADDFPDFYEAMTYQLVEISPDNRTRQKTLLSRHLARVDWCEFADLKNIRGCFLSNELVDAFPVRLFEKHNGVLKEVYVVAGENGLGEELRPLEDPHITDYFRTVGIEPVEGNRFEVNLPAVEWMHAVADVLEVGFVLTVDYGYPAGELYAPFRRNGTLMCYRNHQSSDNPYDAPGSQDITAHIDFTALQKFGAERGLVTLFFGPQYKFLMALGFVETLMEMQAREPDEKRARALRLTLKNLIVPDGGMGETFKVLVQGKGVDEPALLCNRSLRDIPLPGAFA
ncbi:SAM-dependent methyltransferase [Desulfuromonas sp. AOP6]|uniref:class I SAM-dependent methyltransferase n=1 Tax=Desulfuromonas sp. AOP6 TaxID=1566351 RepID=UPI0012836527|nr:SAM-dependent methyltransferase [Desulfuromonas sp. AOP6]BCA79192.1 SAM-dependent methyltransferase [Desulfuromonas sp. AOP6]